MDYKQSDVSGHLWHRFSRVIIENPRPGTPTVHCIEDEVIATSYGESIRQADTLAFNFNPDETFDLLNPLTNQPTGVTASGAEVYALVFSYVLHEAKKRDIPAQGV